ncbi:MAG: hypothetical protein AAFO03_29170, partial [Bacteroidota bacterium]
MSWAKPTQAGADNGTSVQFVQPGNCSNLGIASPADYCQDNPKMAVPCYDIGTATGTSPSLVDVDYNFTTKSTIAEFGEIGTTWGTAYDSKSNYIFAASFLKR